MIRSYPCVFRVVSLVVLLAVCAFAAVAGGNAPYRIVGYVVDGEALPKITAGKLDAINFAFAKVDAEHRVFLPGATAPERLRELGALRRDNPRLQILLSIGGWGAGNFSEAASTPAARRVFIDSAMELLVKHELDGLDIDWEYPTLAGPGISHSPDDRRNFSLLLEELRTRLDAPGEKNGRRYLLTIAAADGRAASGLEIARIAKVLDWINLMGYDFYGSLSKTTGHHASLYRSASAEPDSRTAAQGLDEFLRAGTPPDKLVLGVGFYGRHFDEVAPANNGLNQPYGSGGGYLSWRQISTDYQHRDGYVRHWDTRAQAPYLWNPKTRHFISYEDPQSLRAKTTLVREKGLGGIMYWEHGQDVDEQLLDVVVAGLREKPAP